MHVCVCVCVMTRKKPYTYAQETQTYDYSRILACVCAIRELGQRIALVLARGVELCACVCVYNDASRRGASLSSKPPRAVGSRIALARTFFGGLFSATSSTY